MRPLSNLTFLDFSFNQISDIDPLRPLTQLNTLDLSGIRISDIDPLRSLTQLNTLDLSVNQISNIDPLRRLSNLTFLDFSFNQISDIDPLRSLTHLTRLALQNNPLESLPVWIGDIQMDLKWEEQIYGDGCFFHDNPLKRPPPEIVQAGREAVGNYFAQLAAQAEDLSF